MSEINPFTAPLKPIGFYRSGRPIYPICGGSVDAGVGMPPAAPSGGSEPAAASSGKHSEPKPNDAEEPLGEPGLKALRAERERREQLEARVKQLEPMQEQMARLAEVFGTEKGKSSTDDVVAGVQKELAELRHENTVNEIARIHKITDVEDLGLLRDAKDRDHMERLAKRIAAAPASGSQGGSGPVPDKSVGRGGGDSRGNTTTVSAGRDLYRDRHKKNN